jgi:hypothetical protein
VSGIEDKVEELDQSIKHNEKFNKTWIECVKPPWHHQKTKPMNYEYRRLRDTNHR